MDSRSPEDWPPGTVYLNDEVDGSAVILHPQPTEDLNDPLNWSKWSRALNFGLASFYTLMTFVILDIRTVIYGNLIEELGFSVETLNWSFGANTTELAIGCVFKFGRRPVYLLSIAGSLACAIWQAKLQTAGDLFGSSATSGLAGAVSKTLCQMTMAGLFFVHQRATANGIYLFYGQQGHFPGASGGGLCCRLSRIWWWTAVFLAICLFAFIFLYEETKYTPVIIPHSETSDPTTLYTRKPSVIEDHDSNPKAGHEITVVTSNATPITLKRKTECERLTMSAASPGDIWSFFRHVHQPFVLLFTLPAVAYTAVMWGSLLAWFSVNLSTLFIYCTEDPYNFTAAGLGLMNLLPFVGSLFESIYAGYLSDWMIVYLTKRNNCVFEPEMRLWLALPGIILCPGGIAMFGLSMAAGMPWIVPAVGSAIFGFGFLVFGDLSITYLMDCFKVLVGDALVAVAFVRNVFATVFVFALSPWIAAVGLTNLFITTTFMSIALFVLTIPMLIWGKTFRIKTQKQFEKMKARQFATQGWEQKS